MFDIGIKSEEMNLEYQKQGLKIPGMFNPSSKPGQKQISEENSEESEREDYEGGFEFLI